MKTLPILFVMLVAVSTGCDEGPTTPTEIRNVTWKLESIERTGSPTVTVPNPEMYTLRFEDDGRLAVRADCNTCGGRYTLNGASLSMSDVACTLIACSPASLHSSYAQALDNAQSAVVNGSSLVVTGSGFTLRFRS
jgi:heat shock protein HslJ